MDSTDYRNMVFPDLELLIGSPLREKQLTLATCGHEERKGLASICASQSVASTSHGSSRPHPALVSRQEGISAHGGLGFYALKGFSVFSTVLSYFLRFCNGGYRPFIQQAERDFDKVAAFVEEGARLVVKLADEIEAMAHVAELTAQEAEDLALKVEAKTKVVRQTLDTIADVLEGDKKLSTVLSDYASAQKKELAAGTDSTPKESC